MPGRWDRVRDGCRRLVAGDVANPADRGRVGFVEVIEADVDVIERPVRPFEELDRIADGGGVLRSVGGPEVQTCETFPFASNVSLLIVF